MSGAVAKAQQHLAQCAGCLSVATRHVERLRVASARPQRTNKATIGADTIAEIRRAVLAGARQVDVAMHYGISQGTVSKIANGRLAAPNGSQP